MREEEGNEYIAVIIAIDFYRQTITLDSWRLPSCSDDAFFLILLFLLLSAARFPRALPLSFSLLLLLLLLLRLSTPPPVLFFPWLTRENPSVGPAAANAL